MDLSLCRVLTRLVPVMTLLLLCVGLIHDVRVDPVLGGFDVTRGGQFSLESGSLLNDFRSAIATAFPGSTLTGSPTHTPSYLSTIQTLITAALGGLACSSRQQPASGGSTPS
jgi:hypothetical protein